MRHSESATVIERFPWSEKPVQAEFHSESEIDSRRVAQVSNAGEPFLRERIESARAAPIEVSFGRFRLLSTQFLLLEGDKSLPLGSRALEILIALVERPGELITKQELMARVWPNVFVEPANLTVHISALRRALRDGRDGNRFIINIPGRGYRFVARVAAVSPVAAAHLGATSEPRTSRIAHGKSREVRGRGPRTGAEKRTTPCASTRLAREG